MLCDMQEAVAPGPDPGRPVTYEGGRFVVKCASVCAHSLCTCLAPVLHQFHLFLTLVYNRWFGRGSSFPLRVPRIGGLRFSVVFESSHVGK